MHNTTIQPFHFRDHQVRSVLIDGQPWFVLKDICEVLELSNPRNVAARLDEDEKSTVHLADGTSGNPNLTIINESGLYSVLLRSDKPQAKPFRKWVTSEVLPAIRRTGSYSMPANIAPPRLEDAGLVGRAALRHVLEELDSNAARFERIEERLDNVPIMGKELGRVYKLGQELGRLIGYGKAWKLFKERFGLASYRDLPSSEYEAALQFLRYQIISYGGNVPDRLI